MRKIISLFLILCLSSGFYGCKKAADTAAAADMLHAAVLVSSQNIVSDVYSQMYNSVVASMNVDKITQAEDLSKYDVLYIDTSMLSYPKFDSDKIKAYVSNGGNLFLDNTFIDFFDNEFIGAQQKVKIDSCPIDITYSENIGYNRIQELISDFTVLYKNYFNFDILQAEDYGFGIIPSTAVSIAEYNGITLYSMNNFGTGHVFLANALLPNDFSVQSLRKGTNGEYLSAGTVGANILMRSYFAEFVSMQKYGYSVERCFGSFATPTAAWQLHYEDIEGIKNKSAVTFNELAKKYHQFPSYSLVRCPYVWFMRSETVTYLLQDENGPEQNLYEGIYSSGNHMVSMGKWLALDKYDDTDSYFIDSTKYVKRAYPSPCDLNTDGNMDIVCGSADGNIYIYYGTGFKTNYELAAATYITDEAGVPINTGAYSSPAVVDFEGDGATDIITGSEDGTIYFLHNTQGLVYEALGTIATGLPDSMVDAGDLNGDGNLDLVVGSRTGQLYIYYGSGGFMNFDAPIAVDTGEPWASPCIADYNNDGIPEIYIGTYEGYIAKIENQNGTFTNTGYITANSLNMHGNFNLKFGSNCVPRFYDMNKDGRLDIIAGMLEYGNAIPIDSEYFPCSEELEDQVQYFKDNYIYLGIHSYTSEYATFEREADEIAAQKAAFEKYGISWDKKGANQHTWRTSKVGYDYSFSDSAAYDGTYRAQYESGLLWNSGSQTPSSGAVPQVSAENSITIPFYLFGGTNDMLMLQPSNIPSGNPEYADIGAKYDVPMLFYNHCDHIFRDISEQEEQIKTVNDFVTKYNYCFAAEDQLVKAAAASYNTIVDASKSSDGTITLTAKTRSKDIPLYDKKYQSCVGARVIFPDNKAYASDANVWSKKNNSVYVSLDKTVKIYPSSKSSVASNITAVNVPAKITSGNGKVKIAFKENGMMEARVNGRAFTASPDWQTIYENGITRFIKYGKADSLVFER